MLPFVRQLIADQRAVTAIEYTLIVALIASAAIGAMTSVGHNVMNMLGPAANALS
jgi:pilus assembly protein Flp/PilA